MNGIATLLVAMGHKVSGSDLQPSPVLDRLNLLGVETFVGHDAGNVGGVDFLAFSSAVRSDNVEVTEARRRGIPTLRRSEVLAAICASRRALAVSGTHGKTTTTALLTAVLVEAGLDPAFLVGGELAGGRGGSGWGGGEWLVVEADEADGTFLELGAEGVVVTNVEPDHLDYFGDEDGLARAFEAFIRQAPGPRVVCLDDKTASVLAGAVPGVTTYGTAAEADYRITSQQLSASGSSFEVIAKETSLGRFELRVPGAHNVRNATAALTMASLVGAPVGAARAALAGYRGVGRRFELRGSRDGVTYIDDYAHNPGKVRATLAAAQQGHWARIVAVFQPHRYSRTAALWRDFAEAFDGADALVVTGLYAAGEEPVPGVSGRLVADAVSASRSTLPVEYAETRPELVAVLKRMLRPGDLCLTMSAGDLTTLPSQLLGGAGQRDEEEAPGAAQEGARRGARPEAKWQAKRGAQRGDGAP